MSPTMIFFFLIFYIFLTFFSFFYNFFILLFFIFLISSKLKNNEIIKLKKTLILGVYSSVFC